MQSNSSSFWRNKVVLVTGGSAGLGRHITEAFAVRGARVVVAARNQDRLDALAAELTAGGGLVEGIAADVTRQADVDHLLGQLIDRHGRLDALVNTAGMSMRGAAIDATPEQFEQLINVNLITTVRCTRAAAPHLLAQRGHLVNISSLAGRAAARWLGAYPAAKFAVTAYTQQLRLELGPQGLHVMLVCPGPIARDEPRAAEHRRPGEDQLDTLPEAARRPGGGVKTKLLRPERVAAAIVRGCEKRQAELVFPPLARLMFALMQLHPSLADWLVRKTTGG